MAFKFNPFTGNFDIVEKTVIASSDPASGYEGQFLINTSTNILKVYYAGYWQTVAVLTGAVVTSRFLLETGGVFLMENNNNFGLE